LTALVGQAFELSFFVVNMISGMGLALGIDYSLFIVSRLREERARGREQLDAIAAAGATASRAVVFSGIAFVLALTGMVLVPDTILRSLAVGAILVGVVSVLAALTLLPALLGLLGDSVNALRIPWLGRAAERSAGQEGRFWGGIVRRVMRRPVVSLVASIALLLAAAAPVLDLHTGSAGIRTLPDRFPAKQGFLALEEAFGVGTNDSVQVVVDGDVRAPAVRAGIRRLEQRLAVNPLFRDPEVQLHEERNLAVVQALVLGDSRDRRAIRAVEQLRAVDVPAALAGTGAEALVTGETAEAIDYSALVGRWLPIVFAFVLGLSFVLLTIAFRSIVVSAKAIGLNLLSVGAAYGLLVLVFQWGVGNELFGFERVEAVEAWVPLFLFSVLFGLSMDYHVFLLSRIRERFTLTGDNSESVAYGVGSTARLITGAALIIIVVFSGFAAGDLVMFQQMGFGIAVSLLIDATLIRSVLVPAAMVLLGERNWYLPSWLRWLPRVQVEGRRG
nr:MMPL family transporter [Actinomycetota bacterium]